MRYFYFLLAVLFSLFYTGLSAQEKTDTLVTGDFKEMKIEQFVRELEAQTGFHFFYISNQFDSLQITVSAKEQPLKKVLELAFANTSFHFSIDQRKNVFLIKDTKAVSASMENKLYEIGIKGSETKTANSTIAGYVRDDKTHEPLPGVSIFLEENTGIGIVKDKFGY